MPISQWMLWIIRSWAGSVNVWNKRLWEDLAQGTKKAVSRCLDVHKGKLGVRLLLFQFSYLSIIYCHPFTPLHFEFFYCPEPGGRNHHFKDIANPSSYSLDNRMEITALWDIAPCNVVEIHRLSRGTYCLHRQGDYIKRCGRVVNTPVSYSGAPGL
jgi:hypothetical protein